MQSASRAATPAGGAAASPSPPAAWRACVSAWVNSRIAASSAPFIFSAGSQPPDGGGGGGGGGDGAGRCGSNGTLRLPNIGASPEFAAYSIPEWVSLRLRRCRGGGDAPRARSSRGWIGEERLAGRPDPC